MDSEQFTKFIDDAMEAMPAERKILNMVVKALREAGTPVVAVYDGEETTAVRTLRSIQEQVFNLDDAYLMTEDGSWVRLVMGNRWDTLTDYTINLEEALAPVNEYLGKQY